MIITTPSKYMVRVNCSTFNHAPYIEDAMNGFTMQQTTFPYVCTIVDDNSTDGEQEVLRNYLQQHFLLDEDAVARREETDDYVLTFARHKTNQNCFFAVYFLKYNHYSIKKAKVPYFKEFSDNTRYVAWCEGDDYWTDPNKLQRQVDFLNKNDKYTVVAENAKVIKTNIHETTLMNNLKDMDISIEQIINNQRFIPTASVLCRNIFDDDYHKLKIKMDTITWCYFASKGKFRYTNIISSVYRKGNQGITVYTDPLEWAERMEQYFLCIKDNFGQYVSYEQSNYNIYRQYLYAANKYVDKGYFGLKYWKCVMNGIRRKPFLAIKNMGLYLFLYFKNKK